MVECTPDIGKLLTGKGGKVVGERGPELFVGLLCALGAFGCNLQVYAPPVLRVVPALDQTFIYQAVYNAGHGGCGDIEVVGQLACDLLTLREHTKGLHLGITQLTATWVAASQLLLDGFEHTR